MAIITTAQYKTYAGITATTWDGFLDVIIPAAQAMAESASGRQFDSGTRTERYEGPIDSNTIQLRSWPVASITSVKFYTGPSTYSTLSSSEYAVDAVRGILYLPGSGQGDVLAYARDTDGFLTEPDIGVSPRFETGTFAYEVVYVAGYSSYPTDLQYAMYRLVDAMFAARRADPNMKAESIGAYSYTRGDKATSFPNLARELFAAYLPGVL